MAAKRFVFTINNYTEDDEKRLKELECEWIIYGHEIAPTTGTPHLQGAIIFKGKRRLTALHKLFKWDIRIMQGTPQDCKTYCTKEDPNYYEAGQIPEDGRKKGGESTKKKWAEAIKLAEEQNLEQIKEKYPSWYVLHINKFKQIASEAQKDASMEEVNDQQIKKHFLWLCGPSGTGKSHTARRISKELGCEEPYLKGLNKWWNGYEHQKVTIIEEASPKSCEYLASYFKQWCDKWSFTAECKGTVIAACRPEYIIVTSNYSIDTCFPEEADNEPLHRRFTEITLTNREQHVYWPLNQAEFEEANKNVSEPSASAGNNIPQRLEEQQDTGLEPQTKRPRVFDQLASLEQSASLGMGFSD